MEQALKRKSERKVMETMSTYVVNGKCVKDRYTNFDIDENEIKKRAANFENIGIQENKKVSIYCNDEKLSRVIKVVQELLKDKEVKNVLIRTNNANNGVVKFDLT